jgi:hypothetical protein
MTLREMSQRLPTVSILLWNACAVMKLAHCPFILFIELGVNPVQNFVRQRFNIGKKGFAGRMI